MKEKCIRCVVCINFIEVQWQDENDVAVHLDGPSLFVRACVLGQLQHTHLHTPTSPIRINQSLTFDRVLTNCRDPSLFKEVIRGEHVKIELIQISPDYKGGKILARFETPAHKFLFPDIPDGDCLQLVLDKSRKYQCPPKLTYTCSTSLLEVTVQSPVDSIFGGESLHFTEPPAQDKSQTSLKDSQQEGRPNGYSKYFEASNHRKTELKKSSTCRPLSFSRHTSMPQAGLIRKEFSTAKVDLARERFSDDDDDHLVSGDTSHRLHSLLESYLEPSTTKPKESKTPYRVKFKPPVPKFPKTTVSSIPSHTSKKGNLSAPQDTMASISPRLYQSLSSKVGPHEWQACPRRSPKRVRSYSAPNSPAHQVTFKHSRVSESDPLTVSDLSREEPLDDRPPFVVRHPDPLLLKKRDFCGCSDLSFHRQRSPGVGEELSAVDRDGGNGELVCMRGDLKAGVELESELPVYLNENLRMSNEDYTPSGQAFTSSRLSSRLQTPPKHFSIHSPYKDAACTIESSSQPRPVSSRIFTSAHRSSEKALRGKRDLVSKYLVTQPGNMRSGVDSPCKLIEEKIERLKEECCDCKHSADSLGEDDLSEDLERLKASLQAERDDYLSQTAKLLPEQSVTVKIGPRDFWSRRMSEFTGKRHRVLFDETLEKIYNRLYTDASKNT